MWRGKCEIEAKDETNGERESGKNLYHKSEEGQGCVF